MIILLNSKFDNDSLDDDIFNNIDFNDNNLNHDFKNAATSFLRVDSSNNKGGTLVFEHSKLAKTGLHTQLAHHILQI